MLNLSPLFPFPKRYNTKGSAVLLVEQPFSFWFSHCVCVIHFLSLSKSFFKTFCICYISSSNRSYWLWNRIDCDCWRYNCKMFPISGNIYWKLHLLNIHLQLPVLSGHSSVPLQPGCLWDSSQPGWFQFNWGSGKCCVLSDISSHNLGG